MGASQGTELLWFVQMDGFVSAWKRLGLGDNDMRALEIDIMVDPNAAPVIVGTSGVRKLRFAPSSWRTGTSGAVRIYYAFFAAHRLVVLMFAHTKSKMETVSSEQKKVLKRMVEEIELYLERSRGKEQRR